MHFSFSTNSEIQSCDVRMRDSTKCLSCNLSSQWHCASQAVPNKVWILKPRDSEH